MRRSLQPEVLKATRTLLRFMAPEQRLVLVSNIDGEEGEFFAAKAIELAGIFNTMPRTYDTESDGEEAVAYLHYFKNGIHWYITERDMEIEQQQAFGLAVMHMDAPELGYISLIELMANNVELDFYWTPTKLNEIKD